MKCRFRPGSFLHAFMVRESDFEGCLIYDSAQEAEAHLVNLAHNLGLLQGDRLIAKKTRELYCVFGGDINVNSPQFTHAVRSQLESAPIKIRK
jgi:hypothetical protein